MMDDAGRIVEALDAAEVVDDGAGASLPLVDDGSDWDSGAAAGGDEGAEPSTGEAPPVPRAWGYDVEAMNERYALVLMGSNAVIMEETRDGPIEDRHAIRTIPAFKAWLANRFTQMVIDGEIKRKTWADRWLTDRKRRQYRGIAFHPRPSEDSPAPEGYFNLWRGFSREPKSGGRYEIFREHIFVNICHGRKDDFDYIFGWMAHLIQRPRERIGTALVFRGGQGAGKTTIGQVLGALIADHYFLVDDPRYVTGNFNAFMASCLLLQAEEAVWAGDKVAEGRLKGLITSPFQMIEAKGVDPIRLANYVRIIMTSNNSWVVPAGADERRYAVFDVSNAVAQNTKYFAEMHAELEAGGYEALLHDLLTFDLESVDLRRVPRTQALLDQKLRTLDSPEAWWLERLKAGTPTRKAIEWPDQVLRSAVFDDYLDEADRIGIKRRATDTEVGTVLAKLMPGLQTVRRAGGSDGPRRPRYYVLPRLDEARAMFEAHVGQEIDWQDTEAPAPSDPLD